MKITLENGKYTLVHDDMGLYALRGGVLWQNLTGNKLVYCLGAEIERLKAEEIKLHAELAEMKLQRDHFKLRWEQLTGQREQ